MAPRVELIFAGSDQGATATAVNVEEAIQGIGASAAEANRSITTGMSATPSRSGPSTSPSCS